MTATGHAIIGTVIAAKVGNPTLAIPIAIGSHFLADAFPHWDTGYHRSQKSRLKFFVESAIDVLLGFAISFLLIKFVFPQTDLGYATLIIVMSQLPDWLTAPYLFLNWKFPPFTWIYNLQKMFDSHLGLPWGFINQVAILVSIVFLVYFL